MSPKYIKIFKNIIIKCLTTSKNSSILWLIKEIEIRVSILSQDNLIGGVCIC